MTDEISAPPTTTIFLRFPDETTGMAALGAAGLLNENGEFITASHHHALDVLGIITRGGEWDEHDNVITSPEILDGWHVNFRGDVPEQMQQYQVFPTNPHRVFL